MSSCSSIHIDLISRLYHYTTIPRAQRNQSTLEERSQEEIIIRTWLEQRLTGKKKKIMPESIQSVQSRSSTPNCVPCASPTKSTHPISNFLKRLLDWLLPALAYEVGHSESQNSIVNVTGAPVDNDSFNQMVNNSTTVEVSSNRLQPLHVEAIPKLQKQANENNQDQAIIPCKACRVRRKACDLQRPWCSECLDQQILCFYAPPLLMTNKKGRKPKKPSTTLQSQNEIPARRPVPNSRLNREP